MYRLRGTFTAMFFIVAIAFATVCVPSYAKTHSGQTEEEIQAGNEADQKAENAENAEQQATDALNQAQQAQASAEAIEEARKEMEKAKHDAELAKNNKEAQEKYQKAVDNYYRTIAIELAANAEPPKNLTEEEIKKRMEDLKNDPHDIAYSVKNLSKKWNNLKNQIGSTKDKKKKEAMQAQMDRITQSIKNIEAAEADLTAARKGYEKTPGISQASLKSLNDTRDIADAVHQATDRHDALASAHEAAQSNDPNQIAAAQDEMRRYKEGAGTAYRAPDSILESQHQELNQAQTNAAVAQSAQALGGFLADNAAGAAAGGLIGGVPGSILGAGAQALAQQVTDTPMGPAGGDTPSTANNNSGSTAQPPSQNNSNASNNSAQPPANAGQSTAQNTPPAQTGGGDSGGGGDAGGAGSSAGGGAGAGAGSGSGGNAHSGRGAVASDYPQTADAGADAGKLTQQLGNSQPTDTNVVSIPSSNRAPASSSSSNTNDNVTSIGARAASGERAVGAVGGEASKDAATNAEAKVAEKKDSGVVDLRQSDKPIKSETAFWDAAKAGTKDFFDSVGEGVKSAARGISSVSDAIFGSGEDSKDQNAVALANGKSKKGALGWLSGADEGEEEGTVKLSDEERLGKKSKKGSNRTAIAKISDAGEGGDFEDQPSASYVDLSPVEKPEVPTESSPILLLAANPSAAKQAFDAKMDQKFTETSNQITQLAAALSVANSTATGEVAPTNSAAKLAGQGVRGFMDMMNQLSQATGIAPQEAGAPTRNSSVKPSSVLAEPLRSVAGRI